MIATNLKLTDRDPYEKGVVFVDFDGCISICNWRESTLPINSRNKNYDNFHRLLKFDPPNKWMIAMMAQMMDDGTKVVILTGRMESIRKESVIWLLDHEVNYSWMEMRKNDDFRPSEICKAEVVEKYYKEEVRMIFDDRNKIIDHFAELGYPTFKIVARI